MYAAKELSSGLTNENKSNKAPNPKRESHNCHPEQREESPVFLHLSMRYSETYRFTQHDSMQVAP